MIKTESMSTDEMLQVIRIERKQMAQRLRKQLLENREETRATVRELLASFRAGRIGTEVAPLAEVSGRYLLREEKGQEEQHGGGSRGRKMGNIQGLKAKVLQKITNEKGSRRGGREGRP
jgi:hypothetical protein